MFQYTKYRLWDVVLCSCKHVNKGRFKKCSREPCLRLVRACFTGAGTVVPRRFRVLVGSS